MMIKYHFIRHIDMKKVGMNRVMDAMKLNILEHQLSAILKNLIDTLVLRRQHFLLD